MLWIVGGLVAQMLLLKFAGFSIATGLLFALTARGFGRGPLWLTFPIGIVFALVIWVIFARGAAALAAGRSARTPVLLKERALDMDTFVAARPRASCLALQPMNLLYALIGVTLGTAVGVLPGIGPALTVALLLPVTYKLDPGRLADHVRRHLLRRHVWRLDHLDPAQHAGRKRLDRHRARGQQDGARRPRRAGAGHRRDRLVRRRPDRDARARLHRALGGQVRAVVRAGANISR